MDRIINDENTLEGVKVTKRKELERNAKTLGLEMTDNRKDLVAHQLSDMLVVRRLHRYKIERMSQLLPDLSES